MKKLLILLMAFSLLMACNNDKGPARDRDNRSTNSRDKDDYRSDDKNSDDRNTSDDRDNDNRDNTNRDDDPPVNDRDRDDDSKKTSSGRWSSSDVDEFVNSCVGSAVDGGMNRSTATNYCECMQVKLERLYPNPNDAANIDINSSSMQKMVRDCLGQ